MRVPGLPEVVPGTDLPGRVTICEVGPRDGLQNEPTVVPTDVKVELVQRLLAAGLPVVETTSFVRPERVPQLAVRDVAVFASATETFARRNLNRSWNEQFAMFAPVVAQAREAGARVRGYLSMCFGDPWEGSVDVVRVVDTAIRLRELGCEQLSLGDTIGVATPGQVRRLVTALIARGVDEDRLAVHFHDTYGQALANTLAALQVGVTSVDASAGGLGGCPYARSATGNLATEDLVWMLDGLGIESGVDLDTLATTSRWMATRLGRPSPSRVLAALTAG
jgi:hydroxymethylglutaryl-CoA lyase